MIESFDEVYAIDVRPGDVLVWLSHSRVNPYLVIATERHSDRATSREYDYYDYADYVKLCFLSFETNTTITCIYDRKSMLRKLKIDLGTRYADT